MKTALITGASSGIGWEMAKLLARQHYDLILVARREDRLRELETLLAPHVGVTVWALDLAKSGAAQALFEAVGDRKIDLLVNNAGFGDYGPFADADATQISAMMQVNMVALTEITRLFLPAMIARGNGRILNVASVAGFFSGPLMSVYYASKAYVLSFSEALANELEGTGVSVTCLCPGATTTGFQSAARMDTSKLSDAAYMSARVVAKRGLRATLRGDVVCIPGLSNQLFALVPRLLPRGAMTRAVRRIQDLKSE